MSVCAPVSLQLLILLLVWQDIYGGYVPKRKGNNLGGGQLPSTGDDMAAERGSPEESTNTGPAEQSVMSTNYKWGNLQ
jgi:hypothetical protein